MYTLEQKLKTVVPEGPNWGFSLSGCTLSAHLEAVIKAVRENAGAISLMISEIPQVSSLIPA